MYKVISTFADLNDHKHIYHPGDTFPRDGVEVSEDRIRALLGSKNLTGHPVIEAVKRKRRR